MSLRGRTGDIESIWKALYPRIKRLLTGDVVVSIPTTVAPHTHAAVDITFEPVVDNGVDIAAEECQSSQEELLDEKLARSGAQPMEGHLQMDDGLGPWRIYDILDLYLTGGVGAAKITGVRRITMTGDDGDNEARVENLDRIIFNLTATQGVIQDPSRIDFNPSVTPGSDYTEAEGRASWSDLEETFVVHVLSGPGST